jgi:pilus assembly protein CpaC
MERTTVAGMIRRLSLVAVSVLAAASIARAGDDLLVREPVQHHEITLTAGKSVVLRTVYPIDRVAVSAPDIADYLRLSPDELYISGKAAGVTNMILWQKGSVVSIYDIEVEYDLSLLKKQLADVLPGEKEIRVIRTKDTITLSGRVSSTGSLSQALALAESHVPKGKVNNLLEVGGVHQVMLEVRVAEMDKSTGRKLGIDLTYVRGGNEFGVSMLAGLQEIGLPDENSDYLELLVSPAVKYLFQFEAGNTTWAGLIDALKEDSLAKILAEPTLVALSGQTASFLVGGEFPIPIPDEDHITITYKRYGVQLAFTPMVLSQDRINIEVNSSVSELDFSTAVKFTGYVVPGLTAREAKTMVELGDGQSFAIAGLLQETMREEASRYPFLGEIPILGALFRSTSFQKDETELVIIVTPHLVKPVNMDGVPLPTDLYQEPDDMEFFFNFNRPEKESVTQARPRDARLGTLDGKSGHAFSDTD